MTERFAVCLDTGTYEGALLRWKVYAVLEDSVAESDGLYRVIDESGEDYLYPQSWFSLVELSATAASLYRSSHSKTS